MIKAKLLILEPSPYPDTFLHQKTGLRWYKIVIEVVVVVVVI